MHTSGKKGEETQAKILLRLKRAKGHLEKVIQMIESENKCLDVSRQLHAVAKAVTEAKRVFIQDHIEHCLDQKALNANEMTLEDFKEITKYL